MAKAVSHSPKSHACDGLIDVRLSYPHADSSLLFLAFLSDVGYWQGVDRISVGGLTHQAVNIDVGLDAE